LDRPKRVYWHQNQWMYKSTDVERQRGMKSWIPLGTDLDAVASKLQQVRLPELEPPGTFAWLANWYLDEIAPNHLSPRTIDDRKQCINRLIAAFPDTPAHLIAPNNVQTYIYSRMKSSPRRAKMEYTTMSQIYRWGIRFGYVSTNPATDLYTPPEKPRDRYVTHEELAQFVECNPDWGGPVGLFAYAVGQRLSDILALNYHPEVLTFRTQKTSKRASIRMTPYLNSLIERINPDIQEGELIVKNANGEPYNRHSFGHRWRRCMDKFIAAGGERFTFHDLKAKFVTDSQTLGLDPVRQALHDNPRTTKVYLRSRETTEITSLVFDSDIGVRPLADRQASG
jgi:integrase